MDRRGEVRDDSSSLEWQVCAILQRVLLRLVPRVVCTLRHGRDTHLCTPGGDAAD